MAKKLQKRDEKHPYASPTTPGLFVTLRAYLIELICMNIDKKIGPRFWKDTKWWGPKFRRETRGVKNIFEQLDETDTLTQIAVIQIIQERNIKSLTHKATISKVIKYAREKRQYLENQRQRLGESYISPVVDSKTNSTFVDLGDIGPLARIRSTENGQG